MYDIMIQNAKIVSPESTVDEDVAIKGKWIASLLLDPSQALSPINMFGGKIGV